MSCYDVCHFCSGHSVLLHISFSLSLELRHSSIPALIVQMVTMPWTWGSDNLEETWVLEWSFWTGLPPWYCCMRKTNFYILMVPISLWQLSFPWTNAPDKNAFISKFNQASHHKMNNPALQFDQGHAKCLITILWLQNSWKSNLKFLGQTLLYIMSEHLT